MSLGIEENSCGCGDKRARATVIVEREGRILLAETRGGLVLLPGGGIHPGELPIAAAARELQEETGLMPQALMFLFRYDSETNAHHVFWCGARGVPCAQDDAFRLHMLAAEDTTLPPRMSLATREIIARFHQMKADGSLPGALGVPPGPG